MAESAPSVARASLPPRGPHRVAPVMGTVISIDVRDPAIPESAVDAMLARLEEIEGRFSPYRPDSEISRIVRVELAEADARGDIGEVVFAADQLDFHAVVARPDHALQAVLLREPGLTLVVQDEAAPLDGGDVLVRMEAEHD